ncbi:MAG TPA: NAD(P)-dependent oxidoreductase [Phototrophicaceae bacterium]|nr:NAD(P)-dependent oxidoreductase [Phototrophicaceae bacterium]
MTETKPTQRIFVTGGTGFTGSHLVKRLLQRGHEVVTVDNQKGMFYDELVKLGAQVTIGSVTDRDLMFKLTEGCDTVHHLAAAFRAINLPKEMYWNINVEGTRHLLDAAMQYNVKKFVYCSTCGVHGNVQQPPAAETAPITPADYYQYTKYEGEKVAQDYIQKGLDVTILRPAAIYGPGDPERWVMLFKHAARGRFFMFGSGKATYHPLYIENLVDAFELAAEKEAARGQTYLIADECYYTLNDLVRTVGDVLNLKVQITHLPFWPLWTVALATEIACLPFRISPPIFRRRVDWYRQNRAFDISKAKRELGYNPRIDLKTGLTQTAQWYRQHQYI